MTEDPAKGDERPELSTTTAGPAAEARSRDEHDDRLLAAVSRGQERKLRSRREGRPDLLRGFGASGIVGWSVTVPTLAGIAVGVWLDRRYDQTFSWTLTLMAVGLVVGCLTAWYWVRRESEGD